MDLAGAECFFFNFIVKVNDYEDVAYGDEEIEVEEEGDEEEEEEEDEEEEGREKKVKDPSGIYIFLIK